MQPQPQTQPQQQPQPLPPPQPQPYPPGYASPAEQPPAATGPTPLEKWLERSGIVPVFSVGFILGGSGEVEEDCEASGTPTSIDAPACSDDGFSESIDYKDESGMVLRTDLLFPVSSRVRIGPGAMLVLDPTYEIELGPFGNIKYETGTELSLFGAVDAVFPTGETFGLIVRGQLGLTALFAGEDHADAIDGFREECRASSYDSCDTREGPFFAPHIGVGFGLLLQASNIALRVELLGQYKRQPFWHTEVSGSGVSRTMDGTFAGTRSVLLVGLEL